jgi:hypothetical protein
VVGNATFKKGLIRRVGVPLLIERLLRYYPPTHTAYLYEAGHLPRLRARDLAGGDLFSGPHAAHRGFTLYIPPAYPTVGDSASYGRMTALQSASA